MEALRERRLDIALGEGFAAAFLGEEVDGEGGVAVGGEPGRDRSDVVVEPAVLVDHEHRALGRGGRGEETLELDGRAGEGDRFAPDGGEDASGSLGRRRLSWLAALAGGATEPGGAVVSPGAAEPAAGAHASSRAMAAVGRQAEEGQPSQGLPTGDDPVRPVLANLGREVVVECHRPRVRRSAGCGSRDDPGSCRRALPRLVPRRALHPARASRSGPALPPRSVPGKARVCGQIPDPWTLGPRSAFDRAFGRYILRRAERG